MNSRSLILVVLGSVLVSSHASAAPNMTGAWRGKIVLNRSKIPGANDPKNAALFNKQASAVARTIILLALNKTGSFSMSVTNSPVPSQNKVTNGKWTLKGNKLTLLANQKGVHPNPFTISKDGKSFTVEILHGMASMVFRR